jgi:hypothetical protein
MKGLWCANIPTVTVPMGETPKPLTLILPYYENRAFFGAQIVHWRTMPDPLRKHLSVIVVDDGSPYHPAEDVLSQFPPCSFLRLFRIEVDIRWNWLAARNIGAHYARDGWLLLTDMDHVLPIATLQALIYGQHDPSLVYVFHRTEHTGERITPHSASFFMTRKTFWKIGGYDEALSGHYGTDGEFRHRLAKVAGMRLLTQHLERHEYQGDSSTLRYKRKQPEDAGVRRIVAARRAGWTPTTLSFPYHEVTPAHA